MDKMISTRMVQDLITAITNVCPNNGAYIDNPADVSTWGFHPAEEATEEQIKAAQGVISAFPVNDYQPGGAALADSLPTAEEKFDAIFSALAEIGKSIPLPQESTEMIASCEATKVGAVKLNGRG
jgi:hypothetical protein